MMGVSPVKRLMAGVFTAGLLMVPLSGAAVAKSEMPEPGEPGCVGKIVAIYNHNSGALTPQENDSRGPGYFIAPDGSVKDAIAAARAYCEVVD